MPGNATVLIPARDEAARIGQTVRAALASDATEVIVLDDGSSDGTAEIARAVAIQPDGSVRTDPQLMIEALLPEGTDAERAWVLARHRPYPPMALVEPGRLTAFKALNLPTGYVLATLDRAVAPERASVAST